MKKPTIRRESSYRIGGRPLFAVAFGPDPDSGESHGTARGVIALGAAAAGVLAAGGRAVGRRSYSTSRLLGSGPREAVDR